MKYRVTHSTRYGYDEAIPLSHNVVRMRPREHGTQTCLQYQMLVLPQPTVKSEGRDYFGNHVTWFSLQEPHNVLRIAAQSDVEVVPSGPYELDHGPSWEEALELLSRAPDREILGAREFTFESAHVPWSTELAGFARQSFAPGRPLLACVLDLTERIHNDFKFLAGSTEIDTTVEEVFHSHQGVCQDFAHLQICCLRSLGFSARYVSGYLVDFASARQATTRRRGRLACLGQRIRAWHGLGGIRSHQRRNAQRRAHHSGLGPRL